MDSSSSNSQTQASGFSRSLSNHPSEHRSPSPNKNTFNPDCLKIVGRYRHGTLSKTNAFLELFKRALQVDQSEFGGRSVAELVAPYHRMLDSFERKLSGLENKIVRTRKKLQKMERDNEATMVVKSSQMTWTPKKTLSQRLTNPTLLQRMTSRCTKSNENLNSTSQTFLIPPSLEGRRNSLHHYERPTLYS